MNTIRAAHNFFQAIKPSFKISILSLLSLFSPILLLLPSLKPEKNVYQSLFYIALAFFIASFLYSIGIITNRILDLEDSQNTQQKLQDNINSLNEENEKLKEENDKLARHSNQQNVSLTTSEKIIDKLTESTEVNPTITETFTQIHTVTINNTSEESPKDNKTKIKEKGVQTND